MKSFIVAAVSLLIVALFVLPSAGAPLLTQPYSLPDMREQVSGSPRALTAPETSDSDTNVHALLRVIESRNDSGFPGHLEKKDGVVPGDSARGTDLAVDGETKGFTGGTTHDGKALSVSLKALRNVSHVNRKLDLSASRDSQSVAVSGHDFPEGYLSFHEIDDLQTWIREIIQEVTASGRDSVFGPGDRHGDGADEWILTGDALLSLAELGFFREGKLTKDAVALPSLQMKF